MATQKTSRAPAPTARDVEALRAHVAALGNYDHLAMRAQPGHIVIGNGGAPVARLTPIGGGAFGLSFCTHDGRWERMPFFGPLGPQASSLVSVLGPYLAPHHHHFPDVSGGSEH